MEKEFDYYEGYEGQRVLLEKLEDIHESLEGVADVLKRLNDVALLYFEKNQSKAEDKKTKESLFKVGADMAKEKDYSNEIAKIFGNI